MHGSSYNQSQLATQKTPIPLKFAIDKSIQNIGILNTVVCTFQISIKPLRSGQIPGLLILHSIDHTS